MLKTQLYRASPLRGGGQRSLPERHCEECNDEAIQQTEGLSITSDCVTLADALSRAGLPRSRWSLAMTTAFTMAEILLSLTIIGVVAAITLPSLTGNINERTWNTQRKALYARFSQAIALMPALNGYGTLAEGDANNVAETFITNGLAKVMKINNICDSEHLQDCGIASKITTQNGDSNILTSDIKTIEGFNPLFTSDKGIPVNTKAAAFETANGESILTYYNPACQPDMHTTYYHDTQPKMCANFVYDLNGNKGPNTMGKDIGFISAIYPSDPAVVAPIPLTRNATSGTQTAAGEHCKNQDDESRVPNIEELAAMFYNRHLIDMTEGAFWSSSVISSGEDGTAWTLTISSGSRGPAPRAMENYRIRCIKR